jgi:hypothetical protein
MLSTPLNNNRSADAIEGIESLIISFLSQLSLSLPPVHDSEDNDGDEEVDQDAPIRKKTKTPKIELQLADRKKITPNGCALLLIIQV